MISKSSQQTLRSFTQDRLLRDMLSSSDTESMKQNKKALGYLLVLDSYTSLIVNSVVQMKELLDAKIMGLEVITTKRKAFPNAQAIYFLEPTERNIEYIVADSNNKLYNGLHLYFTRSIPESLFDILKEHPEVVEKLISFKELNLDFLVVDDFQFNLGMNGLFNRLYAQRDDSGSLNREIAEKLFTLVSVLLPTNHLEVISEKGTAADKVATHLVSKFRVLQEKYPEVLSADSKAIKVLILDRYAAITVGVLTRRLLYFMTSTTYLWFTTWLRSETTRSSSIRSRVKENKLRKKASSMRSMNSGQSTAFATLPMQSDRTEKGRLLEMTQVRPFLERERKNCQNAEGSFPKFKHK
jgi:hypothetical protein